MAIDFTEIINARGESLEAIANALGFEYVDYTILAAIAELRRSLQLRQDKDPCHLAMQRIGANLGFGCFDYIEVEDEIDILKMHKKMLEDIAKQIGANSCLDVVIAAKIEELKEKSAIADQLQADLAHTDLGKPHLERNYYREILDRLCDELGILDFDRMERFGAEARSCPDIGKQSEIWTAIKTVVKHQEMSLDFTSQHNDDLREKLAESQSLMLKYLNRIVELENEVRSLQDPATDYLSDAESMKLIRVLLHAIPE